jgi:hypothetical protein
MNLKEESHVIGKRREMDLFEIKNLDRRRFFY